MKIIGVVATFDKCQCDDCGENKPHICIIGNVRQPMGGRNLTLCFDCWKATAATVEKALAAVAQYAKEG